MQTALASTGFDFISPAIIAATTIADRIARALPVTRQALLTAMTTAYGKTSGQGAWSQRDAYDVLELAQVLALKTLELPESPAVQVEWLIRLVDVHPTQSVRSESRIALQRFSTTAEQTWSKDYDASEMRHNPCLLVSEVGLTRI